MDLNTITAYERPRRLEDVANWSAGHAFLAGGTWLFSEPQVGLHTLVDLETLAWEPLRVTADGLEIAATCKVAELDRFTAPGDWTAAPLFRQCSRSFLASFKIWNEATVGGNLVMALPAGPMISLTAALEGVCTLWPREGAPRQGPVAALVVGNHETSLAPGELLRSVLLPVHALRKRTAFRRFSLTHLGRSEVLLIGTRCPEHGEFRLTVTAATVRPKIFTFPDLPSAADLSAALETGIVPDEYLDDPHGTPAHRRHLTFYFAEQIRAELT